MRQLAQLLKDLQRRSVIRQGIHRQGRGQMRGLRLQRDVRKLALAGHKKRSQNGLCSASQSSQVVNTIGPER